MFSKYYFDLLCYQRLAKVKADVRKRRSEREKIEKAKEKELDRRRQKLEDLFSNFHIESSGRIEISIVNKQTFLKIKIIFF